MSEEEQTQDMRYLVILVGCDSCELCPRKDYGVEIFPVQVLYVTGLHDMQSRLVAVHAIDYDL